jgi:hypothetical protein
MLEAAFARMNKAVSDPLENDVMVIADALAELHGLLPRRSYSGLG